jgi:methylated-DNA-[protein]-cysteine S-methyltransferase
MSKRRPVESGGNVGIDRATFNVATRLFGSVERDATIPRAQAQQTVVRTPIGEVAIAYRGRTVLTVSIPDGPEPRTGPPPLAYSSPPVYPAGSPPQQVVEYFRGERKEFEVELDLTGATGFDLQVWHQMLRIPYGSQSTYGKLAERVGRPGAARAVGGAAHRNPIPLIIPCHRVVGSNGSLTGYGPGIWKKRWLLALEATHREPA